MRRQMQEILPGLFLGPYAAAMKSQREKLQSHGITHIVCVRQDCETHWVRLNMPESFTYLTIELADSPTQNIIPYFSQFSDYVDNLLNNGNKVLVHGNGGISRSAALVAAYIMRKELFSANDAIKFVQSKRFCVFPNEGFRRQLYEYEPILRASLAASMRGLHQPHHRHHHPPSPTQGKRSIRDVDPDDMDDGKHHSPH